ncbi:MAG: M16 family metallopeptidase [Bacteroidia bacterium]
MERILDRKIAPEGKPFRYIALPNYAERQLNNGIKVYLLQHGNVEACEIQAVFKAGASFEPKVGLSDFVPRNMSEGTENYTAQTFAEALDKVGAWMNYDAGNESVSINLACLSHLVSKALPLMQESMLRPTFPKESVEKLKQRTLQRLSVSQKKTSYMAAIQFPKLLFGDGHPYSNSLDTKELQAIQHEDLAHYHENYLYAGNYFFVVVGKFDEKMMMHELEENFGHLPVRPALQIESSSKLTEIVSQPAGFYQHEMESGLQSSLRIGHLGMNRLHPDSEKMELVNTFLGGYFGSRLMKNIREEKGYTYGINSHWVMYRYGGYLQIGCDAGNEYVQPVIEEVKKEIELLQNEGVSQAELDLVRNYRMGKSIGERETLFQLGNLLRFSLVNGISFAELDRKYQTFAEMSTNDVQELANKHLKINDLRILVCGKK